MEGFAYLSCSGLSRGPRRAVESTFELYGQALGILAIVKKLYRILESTWRDPLIVRSHRRHALGVKINDGSYWSQ